MTEFESNTEHAPQAAPQAPTAPQTERPATTEDFSSTVQQPASDPAQPFASASAPAPEPAQPFVGQQQSYAGPSYGANAAPVPPQPVQNIPGMPLMGLTGGMKFGWAAAGFLMGPVAILLAWLTNAHNFPDAKKDAVKFSLFGFLAQFVIGFIVLVLFGFAACAATTTAISGCGYYY